MNPNTAAWARDLAHKHLESQLPRRWAHTQGVARQARNLAPVLGSHADLLEAAAWLHDIGYAPDLVETGFHPLDGARYLRDTHHANTHLCRLVAHHSCALIEARERGLSETLTHEFAPKPPLLSDSLIYCDMTTSPDGSHVTAEWRIKEIYVRYTDNHPVNRAISKSHPILLEAVESVLKKLACANRK